jgi:UDP-glucuronate 4-epimerase
MWRDFTYIDDIIDGIEKVLFSQPTRFEGRGDPGPGRSATAPYRIYNIGNDSPVSLLEFISIIERCLGKEAEKVMLPMQLGDIEASHANVTALVEDFGFRPSTPLEDGLKRFVDWYVAYLYDPVDTD